MSGIPKRTPWIDGNVGHATWLRQHGIARTENVGQRVVDESSADDFLNAVLDSGINFIDIARLWSPSNESATTSVHEEANTIWRPNVAAFTHSTMTI